MRYSGLRCRSPSSSSGSLSHGEGPAARAWPGKDGSRPETGNAH